MKRSLGHALTTDGPSDGAPAPWADSPAELCLQTAQNLSSRLISAAAIMLALGSLGGWAQGAGWFAVCAVLLLSEFFIAERIRADRDEGAPPPNVTATVMLTMSGVWFAVAAAMLWTVHPTTGPLLALALVCAAAIFNLMNLHSNGRLFACVMVPQWTALAAGAAALCYTGYVTESPGLGVAGVLAAGALIYFFEFSRRELAAAHKRLEAARTHAEEQGRAAEAANAAKSAFLAIMSHEIRTPLNGVLGMAQAMGADELSSVQKDRLDVVRQSGEALLAILNDVLDLSKIEAGKLELEAIDFDLEEIGLGAHAAFTAIANKQGLSFDLSVSPEARGAYRGDPVRVRQILYNLVSNALKFTAAGEVRVLIERPDEALRLVVSDTGCGIAPDRLELLFQPFTQADASTTRRFGGTGLGLSICRDLASLMGGSVEVESSVDVGTTFTVRLPLERVELTAPHLAPAPRIEEPLPSLRVLAAEDNTVNQLVLRTLLHQVGVEPVVVSDGAQAVDAWRREHWDVILMDVQMPVLDGPAAARAIRLAEIETGRHRTPILALTANAMAHQIAEYAAAGMDGHISKPIEAARLYALLQSVLDTENESEDEPEAAAA